ncbi:MAG: beta strand repeat-containing protein [Verrucomicrobiota bacterium JB025]|nr:hypothetical protein [Verrucomicrobiota bacterium JB025]
MKLKKLPWFSTLLHPLCIATTLVATASADTIIWDGGGDATTYEDDLNWTDDIAPADDLTTDIAQLTGGSVDLSTTRQVSGLDFAVGTTLGGAGSLEIGADGITVGANSIINTLGLVLNEADTTITFTGGRLSWGTGIAVSGTGALTLSGSNTLFIDGNANTFSGGTTITGGATASLKGNEGLGSGPITIDDGKLHTNGTNTHLDEPVTIGAGGAELRASNGRLSLQNTITGAGDVTVVSPTGSGGDPTVYWDADNSATFTGNITVTGETALLTVKSQSVAMDVGPANLTLEDGGTLKANGNINTNNRNLIVSGTGGIINTAGSNVAMNSTTLSGTAPLTIIGGGTSSINTGPNTHSGGVTLDGAQMNLQTTTADALGTGTITLDNGGAIKNSNNRPTINNEVILGSGGGTLIAGWSNKNMTVNGLISGDGTLTIGNDSSAVIPTNTANTYTGGTIIEGNVLVSTGTELATGDITLDDIHGARAKIQNNDSHATIANNIILSANGGRLQAGWNKSLTINGVISGTGPITIAPDSGTVTFAGANTYSGETIVDTAKLAVNGNSIPDAGTLSLTTGAVVNVTGTETVSALNLGGIAQAEGTYGATGSGAATIDDTYFTGTGVIEVAALTGFDGWAATNAGNQSASEDFDGDGTPNGVEYFMNAAAGFTANPQLDATNKITWPNGGNIAESQYGTQFVVQTSTDLVIWNDVDSSDPNLENLTDSLSYTSAGAETTEFVRLMVTPQ